MQDDMLSLIRVLQAQQRIINHLLDKDNTFSPMIKRRRDVINDILKQLDKKYTPASPFEATTDENGLVKRTDWMGG